MTTQTGQNSRTLTGYVSTLLEYPRWLIERDVDFTNCRHNGNYDVSIAECADCSFGEGCRWLNCDRTPTTSQASLDDLMIALLSAMQYVQQRTRHGQHCNCQSCAWLREARHFVHSRRHLS